MVTFTVNGTQHRLDIEPDTPLLWALRDVVGLTGTKYGCGIAQCGACTVHINGQPMRSCSVPIASVEGGKPLADSDTGLFGDFELNRSASLLLDYRRSIVDPPAGAHVVDFKPNEVAAPELAVNGQIEHREITFAAL